MEEIIVDDKYKIVLEKVNKIKKGKDPLIDILDSPAHVNIDKIKQINLSAIEEELWTT